MLCSPWGSPQGADLGSAPRLLSTVGKENSDFSSSVPTDFSAGLEEPLPPRSFSRLLFSLFSSSITDLIRGAVPQGHGGPQLSPGAPSLRSVEVVRKSGGLDVERPLSDGEGLGRNPCFTAGDRHSA